MIIDFHVHAMPDEIRRDREKYFPSEPAFELLYGVPGSRLAGVDEILQMMDEQGVDVSVIFGFPWRNPSTFKANNDYILDAVTRHPGRLIGLCCLDPLSEDAPAEVERCLNAGMRGVGEVGLYRSGIDESVLDRMEPLVSLCRQKQGPFLVHTNEPVGHQYPGKAPLSLAHIYGMAKRFSDAKLVLAHWGGGIFFYSLLKKEVRDVLKNVYFDTAASPFLYEPGIYRHAIECIGPDRILLGTDYPLLEPSRYFKEMAAAGLSGEERSAICGDNAARLLGIAPPAA